MTRTRLALTASLLVLTLGSASARQSWYALYDEAVKHVLAGEFQQAETKLLQAKKDGPGSGRNVLRYGSLRDDYFPDYYLGIVYQSTGRPKEALDAFDLARKAKINPRDDEFKLIGAFEQQAKTALATAANNPPAKGGVTPPPPATGGDNTVDRSKFVAQFDQLLNTSRGQLEKKNFDGAEQSANNARALSDKQGLGTGQRADALLKEIAGTRLVATVEEALNRKDATAARRAFNLLSDTAPTFADNALKGRLERLERDSTPAIPVTPAGGSNANFVTQFESLFAAARNQLGQRSFDAAEQSASNAGRLAIKQGLGQAYEQRAENLVRDIDTGRRTARIETAIKGRDVPAARKELAALVAVHPQYDPKPLTAQVDRIDNEINATSLQRNAMRAFFNGGYQESLSLVAQIERTGMLTARTQFYRACSLAALAATSTNPAQDKRLADAKRFYSEAAKAPEQFREDLRYISPKVKQLLGI